MNCHQCKQPVEQDWAACPYCNAPLQQTQQQPPPSQFEKPSVDINQGQSPYKPPIYGGGFEPQKNAHGEGDATGGRIPYKNPKALIAYYLGIASGLPLIGFPLGVAAFILGIMGLRDRKRNPVIKGSVHAGIGIGCGGLFAVFWALVIGSLVVAIINGSR